MKCIDAHAHLAHHAEGFHELVDSGAFDEIWLMDLSGYELGGIRLADESEVLDAVKAHPGVVYAFGHLDFSRPVDQIDRLREKGFIGLKPYKPDTGWNDEKFYPYYERAEQLGMPILFHTGMAAPAGEWRRCRAPGRGFGPDGMRPAYLAGVAEAFPNLSIIGGHLGYPWIEETFQNLYYYNNIVHDISGYRNALPELLANLDRFSNDGSGRFLNEKFLFATDQFYGIRSENERALKLKEFWTLLFELIGSVYYRWGAPEEAEKFFYGNARRLRSQIGGGGLNGKEESNV